MGPIVGTPTRKRTGVAHRNPPFFSRATSATRSSGSEADADDAILLLEAGLVFCGILAKCGSGDIWVRPGATYVVLTQNGHSCAFMVSILTTNRAKAQACRGGPSALLVGMLLFASPAAARETIGVYKMWAAFRDDRPSRCFAVSGSAGLPAGARSPAFASVATWPARRTVNQLHMRLSRAGRDGSAILLTINARVFQLVGRRFDAWAPNSAVDRAIVAAMRTGVGMTVTARDERGNAFTDRYVLNGAASAIDAAVLACRAR